MDFTIPQREADHNQEHLTSKAESSKATDTAPSSPSNFCSYDICLSNLPLDPFQSFTAISPEVSSSIPYYYSAEVHPDFPPTIYSPYYDPYVDNYIFEQPLVPSQYPSLQNKRQSPVPFTPPATPHTIDQVSQCRATTHTHTLTRPPSPVVLSQAAATAQGMVPARDPIITEMENVSIETNNHVWSGRYGNGYGGLVTAAAPFSPVQEHAPYADTNFARNVLATNQINIQLSHQPAPQSACSIPPSPSLCESQVPTQAQAQTPNIPPPTATETTSTSISNTANPKPKSRAQRKIRRRIRRICHKCETLFSGKSCLVCQHRICTQCGELELGQRGPMRWIGR